jgi:hypothetical protein
MRNNLDRIEARLEAFIESSLYFLPVDQKQVALAHQLVAAIEHAIVQGADGGLIIPNQFTVKLNPLSLSIWESRPGLIDSLTRILHDSAKEAGLTFLSTPNLQLEADHTLAQDHFEIFATTRSHAVEETGVVPVMDGRNSQDRQIPQAFVILNGTTTIPLSLAVINIGRRSDNQITIDDPRVSRTHAQLRAVRGRYVLFDLNSTGGTFVNATRITQQVLNPGDVISIAGVPMIYGEENNSSAGTQHDFKTGRLGPQIEPPTH